MIEIGREGDQTLARQALAQVLEEDIQSPPRVENQDACSCPTFGQSEIAIGLSLCHVCLTIRGYGRQVRPSLALSERVDMSRMKRWMASRRQVRLVSFATKQHGLPLCQSAEKRRGTIVSCVNDATYGDDVLP